jgi:hypothetical protein
MPASFLLLWSANHLAYLNSDNIISNFIFPKRGLYFENRGLSLGKLPPLDQ